MNKKSYPAMIKLPAAEDDAILAYDDEEDEDASSEDEAERVVAETQPAQWQQLPILTSPITDK
jgi:hypothetical protein